MFLFKLEAVLTLHKYDTIDKIVSSINNGTFNASIKHHRVITEDLTANKHRGRIEETPAITQPTEILFAIFCTGQQFPLRYFKKTLLIQYSIVGVFN